MATEGNGARSCGPYYAEGLKRYGALGADPYWAFAAGYVEGHACKVHLGACPAAMFRPSEDKAAQLWEVVREIADRYGLVPTQLRYTAPGAVVPTTEFWLCRDEVVAHGVKRLARLPVNSAEWHEVRGRLCGVPAAELDPTFHLRQGARERCD